MFCNGWFKLHDWNEWKECNRYYNTFGDWYIIHQERTCKRCGMLQLRKIKT